MLIPCPECSQEVSDRAAACPKCAFPIAEELARAKELASAERDRLSRKTVGEVDCPACKARGFVTEDVEGGTSSFYWCGDCEHSGRIPLVQSEQGFWAVPFSMLEGFLAGGDAQPAFLGADQPSAHRYEKAGSRVDSADENAT